MKRTSPVWVVPPTARRLAFLATLLFAAPAVAAPAPAIVCEEMPCSVIRSCSSTGIACDPGDRDCTNRARSLDLEVRCEQQCTGGQRLVYCPPDTGGSDSNVVWILLSAAIVIAFGGGTVLWLVLRKKSA